MVGVDRAKQEAAAARLAKQQGGLKRPRPKAVDPLDPTGAYEGSRWFEAVLLTCLTVYAVLIPTKRCTRWHTGGRGGNGQPGSERMADSTASGALWQQRPLPAPGQILKQQRR